MAFLSTALTLIKSFPAIVAALLELKKMWDQYIDESQRHEAMLKFTEALKNARQNKDTTALTALVNNIVTGQPIK